jgi:hypothetical protein
MRRVVALGGLMAVASAFGLSLLPKVSTTSQEEPRVITIASAVATPSLRFPLLAGGTERARGWVPLAKREQSYPHTVPLAKRGEPHGGGRLVNPERAIGITPAFEKPLLKVPPARRGNRAGARLGSPREAGATLPTRGSPREAGATLPTHGSPREAGATLPTRGSPREAGATLPTRGSPREAGGTLRRGGANNESRSKDQMSRLTIETVPSPSETVPSPSETVPSPIETLQSPITTVQSGNPTAQPSKSHTLGVVLDYPASDLAAQLSQLKAQGVQEVVLRLEALPSREAWQSLLETAEASGLEWRLWLANLPRTEGWTVAPERYRMAGNTDGVYTLAVPDATRLLLAVSPRETPYLRLSSVLELSNGRAVSAIGDTAESVLLLYPLRKDALPDLWDGWDAYRDALLQLLTHRAPKQGFRGWLLHSDWDILSVSTLPTSPLAQAEWQAYLKTRYPDLTELERAWDASTKLERHEQAARLMPLWREGRGLPHLVAPDDSVKPQELDANRSRFWDDWRAFLGERWRILLAGLREMLTRHTPNAEFTVLQTAPDPAELPTPDAFADPQLPTGWHLPAAQRDQWRMQLLLETLRRERTLEPLTTLILEWAGDAERAGMFQTFAREMGIERVYWRGSVPEDAWRTLAQTDAAPDAPSLQPFPATLWGLTEIRRYRSGWWVPSAQPDLQPLLWGFEIHGFQKATEVRTLDAQGKLDITRQLELCLWVDEGEREITLRRFERAPLTAFDLNGQAVRLDVRGDRVRLRVGVTPVRIRGFQSEPICETSVEAWTARVADLVKRGNPSGQDARVLKFNFDNAVSLYRRNPSQGFALLRANWFEFERAFQPYRWIEAENARQHEFGTVRRDPAMSGGATLWLNTRLPIESASATYAVSLREAQAYTLWLAVRGVPSGSVDWQVVAAGEAEATPVAEGTAILSAERAVARYADQCYWLPLGTATLKAGEYRLTLRWKPSASQPPHYAEWDAILIAPPSVQPKHILPPTY